LLLGSLVAKHIPALDIFAKSRGRMRIVLGVLCFGIGVAFASVFAILTVDSIQHPSADSYSPAWWLPGLFAVVLLLAGFLLARRRPKS
jgi:H+/Cl- antiporter ClcA